MATIDPAYRARRYDLWSGLFWVIFGGVVAAHSSTMPIPRHLGATSLTGPGLVPGLLGAGLMLLGAVLVVRSLRGRAVLGADDEAAPEDVSDRRALIALVLMIAYAAAFALRQPFVPCTVAFITLFITAFNWEDRTPRSRLRTAAGALALGLATAFTVEFVFESIFYVRLP